MRRRCRWCQLLGWLCHRWRRNEPSRFGCLKALLLLGLSEPSLALGFFLHHGRLCRPSYGATRLFVYHSGLGGVRSDLTSHGTDYFSHGNVGIGDVRRLLGWGPEGGWSRRLHGRWRRRFRSLVG